MTPSERAKVFEVMFERVMSILDESDESAQFKNFLELVGEPNVRYDETPKDRLYEFYEYGISLDYDISQKRFSSISFMFDTASIRSGEFEPYEGGLPMGLQWNDSCADAEIKFGIAPESARWIPGNQNPKADAKSRASSFWQTYLKTPLHYILIFDSPDRGLHHVGVSSPGRET